LTKKGKGELNVFYGRERKRISSAIKKFTKGHTTSRAQLMTRIVHLSVSLRIHLFAVSKTSSDSGYIDRVLL